MANFKKSVLDLVTVIMVGIFASSLSAKEWARAPLACVPERAMSWDDVRDKEPCHCPPQDRCATKINLVPDDVRFIVETNMRKGANPTPQTGTGRSQSYSLLGSDIPSFADGTYDINDIFRYAYTPTGTGGKYNKLIDIVRDAFVEKRDVDLYADTATRFNRLSVDIIKDKKLKDWETTRKMPLVLEAQCCGNPCPDDMMPEIDTGRVLQPDLADGLYEVSPHIVNIKVNHASRISNAEKTHKEKVAADAEVTHTPSALSDKLVNGSFEDVNNNWNRSVEQSHTDLERHIDFIRSDDMNGFNNTLDGANNYIKGWKINFLREVHKRDSRRGVEWHKEPRVAINGSYYIEPRGRKAELTETFQAFPTVAGAEYEISFWVRGAVNPSLIAAGESVQTQLIVAEARDNNDNGSLIKNITVMPVDQEWRNAKFKFTARSERSVILFTHTSHSGSAGGYLDNVTAIPTGVGLDTEPVEADLTLYNQLEAQKTQIRNRGDAYAAVYDEDVCHSSLASLQMAVDQYIALLAGLDASVADLVSHDIFIMNKFRRDLQSIRDFCTRPFSYEDIDNISCIPRVMDLREGCLKKGTRIAMADGSFKMVEELRIGDKVKGNHGIVEVLAHSRFTQERDTMYSINGGGAFFTAEHPILTPQGWKSVDPTLTSTKNSDTKIIGPLLVGDKIVLAGGEVMVVKSIDEEVIKGGADAYNLSVDGDGSFFANGFIMKGFKQMQMHY